jgi:SAM-dependent methyltransferase/uncharacterized protein YbaR (Trm112 family)
MKRSALNRLRCPSCKSGLELRAIEEQQEEIRHGVLMCSQCRTWYPVMDYIPILLVFKTRVHTLFARRFSEVIEPIGDYRMPRLNPEHGEASIQDTFTEEWQTTEDDSLTFTYTQDDLRILHRNVWLKWGEKSPSIQSILNIGCGRGVESLMLRDIAGGAEVWGVDLNFSMMRQGALLAKEHDAHFLVASLFHLPFEPRTFDLVFSQGVIHHTYSTHAAFKSISEFTRPGGRLFIWVYALEDHLAHKGVIGLIERLQYVVEHIVRPVLSRCPSAVRSSAVAGLSWMVHPLVRMRVRHKTTWRLEHTNHLLRDLFTPRFAYRHSFNEVIEWFEEGGFSYDLHSPRTYRATFGKRLWGIGIIGLLQTVGRTQALKE